MSFGNLKNKYPGKIHFIGIGGIGMSAIAMILNKIGCRVQGSDMNSNSNTKKLEEIGVKCFVGHESRNIDNDVCLIVKTSIIKEDNTEILAAKEKNIKIIRRADMLAEIMNQKLGITISGTHGKTSTTAMVGVLLDVVGLDPMVINGGIINHYGSNAKFGDGKFVVAESDESDASFVDLPTHIGAITNIEPEHLEFYGGDFEKVKSCYRKYLDQIPENGLAALCIDDKEVKNLHKDYQGKNNIITYGVTKEADILAENIFFDADGATFDVRLKKSNKVIKNLKLPTYGIYNVSNALAAITIADFLKFDEKLIKKAVASFSGVKRRFTKTGQVNGVTIIDDYAHHPTELQATFKAARELVGNNKVIAVFQPHKYSRTKDLFDEFCSSFPDVDIAIIADIYSVRKQKIEGITQDTLIEGIIKTGHQDVIKLNNKDELPVIIKRVAKEGDIVICAGAGNITSWANELPELL